MDYTGKSETIFRELEDQYGFFGGSLDQLVAYLNRADLPPMMFTYRLASEVKAIAGLSAVGKKDGFHLRKIIMQCAFN